MYPVSEDYLTAIQRSSTTTYWYGELKTKNGIRYPFSEEDIATGSGKVTREICSGENLEIGTTCSAGLDIGLYIDANRYELFDSEITVFYKLKTGLDSWEEVPLGIFYVTEPPERSKQLLSIHAYDGMVKFNKDLGSSLVGNPYYLLNFACTACGVELGNTQSDIMNMPNGAVDTYTYEEATINTYRDLIGYVAQFLCGYAYIGVDGKLYIAQYSMEPIRTISEDWRYNDYKPCDYETFYTSLDAYFMVTQETEHFTTGWNDGLTYKLGGNPLIQFNMDEVRHTVLNRILSNLAEIKYTPFTVTTPCDPALTVGDVLNFTGNHAVDGKVSAITKQVITIKGSMSLECTGTDPNLNVLTAVQKEIQTAGKANNKDGMYYYDFINAGDIHIDDGKKVEVTRFNYVTTKSTHIDYHGQIKIRVNTTELISDDQKSCYVYDGLIKVIYALSDEIVAEYYPADTFLDGDHLLALVYFFWSSGNIQGTFTVSIECEGCTVDIEAGSSRGYIAGVGLAGDSAWDGSIRVEDSVVKVGFNRMHKQILDGADSEFYTPVPSSGTDNVVKVSFNRMVKSMTAAISNLVRLHKFTVAYNSGDMTYDNAKAQDGVWVVIDRTALGMVTTPNCPDTSTILYVKTKCSGNNVFYIVSFDAGSNWWTFNGSNWVTPDYTQDIYGMFKTTLEAITQAQWGTKLSDNNEVMIRAILIENATLTDIEIYTEVI